MRWAHLDEVDRSQRLLYWVLMFVLTPYFNDSIDHWLRKILAPGGGLGGDPGWEMEHILDGSGKGAYFVWADPDISGIEPAGATYSSETVRHAVLESLLALGEVQPERAQEVSEVISHYALDH